jgi:penicillin-binding protein 2
MTAINTSKIQSRFSWVLKGVLVLGGLVLLSRLTELQVIKGGYFRGLAEGNRIIFDPKKGFEKVDEISNAKDEELVTEWLRDYVYADKLAHIGGYVGETTKEEVGKVNSYCISKGPRKISELIGRSGLEEQYECVLSGIDGEELVEVNTAGEKIRTLGRKPAVPGQDIKTNLDIGLQKKLAEVLKDVRGVAVASNLEGEILALYSSPSYDPNIFIDNPTEEEVESVVSNPDLPFFNRAISGAFPPGSVFKPVVAMAALEEKEITRAYIYDDPGVITIKEFTYENWYFSQYGATEGEIDLIRAIGRSTDTFFYKVGEKLGIDRIEKWAHLFGFGKLTGIDLPGEVAGVMPNPTWKERVKGERWFLGNTYHVSIGQGDITATPVQINTAISAVASGGKLCSPRIAGDTKCEELDVRKENIDLVKEGMVAACSEGGTGYSFFNFQPQVGCKTGTAETGKEDTTHAWFTVFAPAESPEIVLTVLVEEGGEGSKVAGPLAKQVMEYWFKNPVESI